MRMSQLSAVLPNRKKTNKRAQYSPKLLIEKRDWRRPPRSGGWRVSRRRGWMLFFREVKLSDSPRPAVLYFYIGRWLVSVFYSHIGSYIKNWVWVGEEEGQFSCRPSDRGVVFLTSKSRTQKLGGWFVTFFYSNIGFIVVVGYIGSKYWVWDREGQTG